MTGKGRPKALQVETSAIIAKNRTIDTLLDNDEFTKALKSVNRGWVFDSQETGQFPHYSNDLRSLPTHLQKLLNHQPRRSRASTLKESNSPSTSGQGERRFGSATNPEDRGIQTEMKRTEGYHIHTNCVQLAFVDSYTHQATLRTTTFVDDFPVHAWVFIPPSLLDKSLANQEPAQSTPPSGVQNDRVNDAMFSFIAHAPQPIKVQLERLQLLFIMRLKDSFTEFKNSLMQFLALPSTNTKLAKKQAEQDHQGGVGGGGGGMCVSDCETDERMVDSPCPEDSGHLRVQDTSAVRGSTPSIFGGSDSDVSATISGCVLVESVEACIILPSILKAHSIDSSGNSSVGATSPLSPSTPLAGGGKKLPSVAEAARRASDNVNGSARPAETEPSLYDQREVNFFGEHIRLSTPSSQSSQTGLSAKQGVIPANSLSSERTSQTSSATPSPRISPTPSQTSLTSQTSQSSLPVNSNMGNVHSPSISSLPTLIESSGDSRTLSGQSFTSRGNPIPNSLGIKPPMRSYSASHLPPVWESTMTHSAAHGRNSASIALESRSYISASLTAERESQSERSSPVVHAASIGGTQTVIRAQHVSDVLWSESPNEGDFILVERPQDPLDTGKASTVVMHTPNTPVEQGIPADILDSTSLTSSQSESVVSEEQLSTGADTAPKIPKSPTHSVASLLSPKQVPSSRRSSRTSLSSRQLKVQSPPKAEPRYNLVIKVGGVCALPNIQAKEISVRVSAGDVKLEEVEVAASAENLSRKQTPKRQKTDEAESSEVVQPKVKARIEIGDQVGKFFPEDASNLDLVLFGKASDLDVSLLLPNALVMKDFFDDEYEAENPVPLHLRIENTRVVLMEEASHGPDHVKSMAIAVDRTDIHRGRKLLDSVDIFLERGREVMAETGELPRVLSTETLHDDKDGDDEKTNVGNDVDERLQQSQTQLIHSFNSFLKALEVHLSEAGEQHLPRDQQVVTILRQIRAKSQEPGGDDDCSVDSSTGKPVGSAVESPPSYYDTVSTFVANCHQSPPSSPHAYTLGGPTHDELIRLKRENERLRQQEVEYQRENAQLLEKKESMVVQLADFDMVTEECKTVKEQLVAYKQVMEKQHEQMERLLNENTELQRKLAMIASANLN